MRRRSAAAVAALLAAQISARPAEGLPSAAAPPPGRDLAVPIDWSDPNAGRGSVHFELGAPFDAAKPTILVVADAQQFYVRPGSAAGLQRELFGERFNVVAVVGRGSSPEVVRAAQGTDGRPDWEKAWRVFNSAQWIEDLDAARREVVGLEGRVHLFGASGGSFLAQQYLATHGRRVLRAFLAAPVNPFVTGELGLATDRFWQEIGAHDAKLADLLGVALERHAADRPRLVMTLQRQNFFVPPERLQEARADLIRALAAGDERRYEEARKAYQVEEVSAFFDAPEGIPVRVRLFEFFQPSGARRLLGGEDLRPDLENQRNFAAPLLDLHDAGRIPAPTFDVAALHWLDTEVFVLAGRWDHTVDYRAAAAAASSYPRRHLFLADDDHMFGRLKGDGTYAALIQAFLGEGLGSGALAAALKRAEGRRWAER